MKYGIVAIAAIVSLLALAGDASANTWDPEMVDFAMDDGNVTAGFVYGESETRPLVLLVHGASDTHEVFDFAPGYRTAKRLAQAGFGVLAIDRVGYGASTRPDGDSLDFATSAGYLHEVVQQVRAGALGFTPPEIILLGPSAGADIVLVEAGTYNDVDGVVITFQSNQLQPELFLVDVNAWLSQGPYFDFGVEFRTSFFYAEPWAQQGIIDLDNETRSLVPRGEIFSALGNESAPYRSQIDVPVLLMQAEHDALFVPQDDSALYTSSGDVSYTLLPRTGHKGFSHPTSKSLAVRTIRNWIDARF